MQSMLDDPIFIAHQCAQARAQQKFRRAVRLNLGIVRSMIKDASDLYAHGYGMSTALELVAEYHIPFADAAERHGYKAACGIEFYRRKVEAQKIQQQLDAELEELDRSRPFAPAWVYEQEM